LAHVVDSSKDRSLLALTNTVAVHNLCRAVTAVSGPPIPLLFASTAMVYGQFPNGRAIVDESIPPHPTSPYGYSKLAAEYIGRTYESEHLSFYVARPFNHIGPGQTPNFVCSGFAKRIHEAEDGGTIEVGNLSARRDFCDVRDVVRAYRLILEHRPEQRLFVLGSGRSVAIASVLETLVKISGKSIKTGVNPKFYRPDEAYYIEAATVAAKNHLDWDCRISLEQSLTELYQAQG